jgi:subtilisin family serine protease
MRNLGLTAAAVLALLGAPAAAAAATSTGSPYVVVYKGSVASADAQTSGLQAKLNFASAFRYGSALKGFAANLTPAQLKAVSGDPAVAYIEPDVTFTAAGSVALAPGETVPVGVRRIGAATPATARAASGVNVAELDTGVDLKNSDLNAVSGVNCISSGAAAQDDNGHGTNVAGIIGARNQGSGVVGVAPGTKLYAVKVMGKNGSGTLSQILCGINWVTANAATLNIKVANLSFAGAGSNDNNCGNTNHDAEHQAICRSVAAGVTYVAAAGDGSTSFAGSIPAAYPEVLTVTGMTDTDGLPGALGPAACLKGQADDRYATYSDYAVSSVDQSHTVSAPGTCVVSDNLGGGTSKYYGTSQSAPHVAGAVALCLNDGGVAGPCAGLAPAQVVARIRDDAAAAATLANGFLGDPLRPVSGKYYGYLVSALSY